MIGIMATVAAAPILAQTRVISDPCAQTAAIQVYSNVFVQKESGDILGYELAIERQGESGANALLYVYEGGGPSSGIPLSGQVSNHRLNLAGTWVEQLTEYPSQRQIVQKHSVEILGRLDSAAFRGHLTISGMAEHEDVRLRRAKTTWFCKHRNPQAPK
jgi:hypothetical protein